MCGGGGVCVGGGGVCVGGGRALSITSYIKIEEVLKTVQLFHCYIISNVILNLGNHN